MGGRKKKNSAKNFFGVPAGKIGILQKIGNPLVSTKHLRKFLVGAGAYRKKEEDLRRSNLMRGSMNILGGRYIQPLRAYLAQVVIR